MRKYMILLMWLSCLSVATRGQTLDDADLSELLQPKQAQAFDYWFDDDIGHLQTVNSLSGTYAFDVSSLANGLHELHCQVKGANGEIYVTDSRLFLTMNDTESLPEATLFGAKLRYWFDEDAGSLRDVSSVSGTYSVDVSPLNDGLHILHYMLVGADGSAYGTSTETFIKMEEILTDPTALETVAAQSVTYWFDDDTDNKQTANSLSGIYTLDVSTLDDGLHLLHYYVVGEDGLPYGLTSRMFLKDEGQFAVHEPSRITKYTYWVNNSAIETVTLDQPVNPYSLISLLPLQTMPICSSNFHFQVDDGVPTIYAKNTFNIRFYDSEDHFVDNFIDNERTFIDYGVSQPVIGAELIESGIGATTEKPAENTIKWYYLSAEPGDSLEFQLDRAATIQLFAPSGKEVYRASGANSVKWGGCHVEETGSYYLALHDVMSTTGNTVGISYNHIDKYSIMSIDVDEIGVAESFVPITILGNGFDKLKSASLCQNGSTITATDHVVVSKGQVITFFHLSGEEPVGDYTLNVEYEDPEEGVVVLSANSQVHLVTPEWGELKVDVSSSMVTVSKSYVTIRVTNPGNVARLYTPLTISFDNPSRVSQINFENFFVAVNKDSQDNADNHVVWTDDFVGSGQEAEAMFLFIPSIKPRETVTLSLSCQLSFAVYLSAVVGKSLNQEFDEVKAHVSGSRGGEDGPQENDDEIECTMAPSMYKYLKEHTDFFSVDPLDGVEKFDLSDFWKHLVDVVGKAKTLTDTSVGIGKIIGSMQVGISLHHNLRVMELSDYYTEEDKLKLINSVYLESPSDILNEAGHPVLGGSSAVWEWQQLKTKCTIDVLPGDFIHFWEAYDPNDIFGYTAESGSRTVREDLKDLYYTIEFENDPELATASAHTVVVNDVLDASVYDLSTFAATGVTIGDKLMVLDHEKSFSNRTMDLRPAVNVIAQISLAYNEQTGVATWTIESLDPMSMEPIEDALLGVLPVNTDGLGIGEVSFDISLKPGMTHGTEISNQASIIFDNNDPIVTPVWTNIMDCVKPESHVTNVTQTDDGMAEVSVSATDELSGPWRYDVYVQYGQGSAWFKAAENVDIGKTAKVPIYPGIDHGFCTIVTDAAGNVEQKTTAREFSLSVPYILGDVNGDGKVTVTDVLMIMDKAQGNPPKHFIEEAADLNDDGAVTLTDAMMALAKILDND